MKRAIESVRVYRLLCDRPYKAKQITELYGYQERYTYRVLGDLLKSGYVGVTKCYYHTLKTPTPTFDNPKP
jgi:hypothetical protein